MPKRRSRQRHFGIIDPGYARVFTQARIVAWQYGYACVMHGSFTRDLDLLLVPWEEHARGNNDQLLRLIASACDLAVPVDASRAIQWTRKPHGRVACSLSFMGFADRRWVDISIAPCVPKHQDGEAEYASWAVTSGVRACGNCGGTGKRLGDPCVRCNGAGQDKHDPWCVGGEKDGICNCGADGVNPSRGGEHG
jgi:hypothetical protein